jgi:hypothetical protein
VTGEGISDEEEFWFSYIDETSISFSWVLSRFLRSSTSRGRSRGFNILDI